MGTVKVGNPVAFPELYRLMKPIHHRSKNSRTEVRTWKFEWEMADRPDVSFPPRERERERRLETHDDGCPDSTRRNRKMYSDDVDDDGRHLSWVTSSTAVDAVQTPVKRRERESVWLTPRLEGWLTSRLSIPETELIFKSNRDSIWRERLCCLRRRDETLLRLSTKLLRLRQ